MIRHFSHNFFTDGRTFTGLSPRAGVIERNRSLLHRELDDGCPTTSPSLACKHTKWTPKGRTARVPDAPG